MRYVATVNGTDYAIDIDDDAATIGDEAGPATLDAARGTPIRTLRIGDRIVPVIVRARSGRGRVTLDIDGHRYEVEALDERARTIREMTARSAPPAGPAPVIAPMPGLVVRVTVAPGDSVVAGQGVLVMEAMKMENEIRAPRAGRVKEAPVREGQAVETGALLVLLE